MGRHYYIICPFCARKTDEPIQEICSRCSNEHLELIHLYHEILKKYPELKHRTISHVFRAMWRKVREGRSE